MCSACQVTCVPGQTCLSGILPSCHGTRLPSAHWDLTWQQDTLSGGSLAHTAHLGQAARRGPLQGYPGERQPVIHPPYRTLCTEASTVGLPTQRQWHTIFPSSRNLVPLLRDMSRVEEPWRLSDQIWEPIIVWTKPIKNVNEEGSIKVTSEAAIWPWKSVSCPDPSRFSERGLGTKLIKIAMLAWLTEAWTINEPHLPYKTGLDACNSW